MIAMALASNPDLLIADEPTTALDVTTQASVIDLLTRLSDERDLAVMLITHDLGIVAELRPRRARHVRGRARSSTAPTAQVFAEPGHPYTQALLAAVPRLTDERGTELASIPGSLPRADAIPPGCRFEARCPIGYGRELCRTERPAFDFRDRARSVACHYEGEARERASGRTSARRAPRGRSPTSVAPLVEVADLAKSYRAAAAGRARPALPPCGRRCLVRDPARRVRRPRGRVRVREVDGRTLLFGLTPKTAGAATLERTAARGNPPRRPRARSSAVASRWSSRTRATRSTR